MRIFLTGGMVECETSYRRLLSRDYSCLGRSVVYRNTGHEYPPGMKAEMVQWFDRHLPVKKEDLPQG